MAGGEGVGVRGFKMFCQNFFYLLCVYVCVCGGGGGGVGVRGFKMFCQNFFYLLCVCVCGGGGGVRFSTCPSVRKITDLLLSINDWSL